MKKKNIKLKIISEQFDIADELFTTLVGADGYLSSFDDNVEEKIAPKDKKDKPESEIMEMTTDAVITDDGERIEIPYEETELTGMDGSRTAVSYKKDDTGLVAMMRDGAVRTALVFEEGRRNICAYETPFMPFELCICTKKVENTLSFEGGRLYLDYIIEVRGAKAERTKFTLEIM